MKQMYQEFGEEIEIARPYYEAFFETQDFNDWYNLYIVTASKEEYDEQLAKCAKAQKIMDDLQDELEYEIRKSKPYYDKDHWMDFLLQKNIKFGAFNHTHFLETAPEFEFLGSEINDLKILVEELDTMVTKLENNADLHMECMNHQDLELMFNKMTLELHNDMKLDTSIELGMTVNVTLNFPIIGSVTMGMVLDKIFWYRSLFDRGK